MQTDLDTPVRISKVTKDGQASVDITIRRPSVSTVEDMCEILDRAATQLRDAFLLVKGQKVTRV